MKTKRKIKRILAIFGIVSILAQEVSFVTPVFAAEEIATNSAETQQVTPAPTPLPTIEITPTITPSVTPTESVTITPTISVTEMPTEAPTATPTLALAPTFTLIPTDSSSTSSVLGSTTEVGEKAGLFSSIKQVFLGILGKPEELKKPFLEKKDFRSNEEVAMSLGDYQPGELEIRITRNNETIDSLETKVEDGKIKIIPSSDLKPGKYTIKVFTNDTKYLVVEQDFTWGVLAINTNKSVYLSNEKAYLQMAVLDDRGHTLCKASLKLEIRSTKSETTILTTQDRTIKNSETCGADNVTENPDYFAYYEVNGVGSYKLKLTNLDNGYEIDDSFEVKESVPFEVERIGATRINPAMANYKMNFRIKANQDFSGEVREKVPGSFEIINTSEVSPRQGRGPSTSEVNGTIIWDVDWKAGENYELSYEYDAPDISPQIYLLGPLNFYLRESAGNPRPTSPASELAGGRARESAFAEQRQWQIASDAANDVILLWDTDNGAVPNGWSCLSCASTDPMYGVFPMAGNTYSGTTAGTDSHNNHTFTPTNQTTPGAGTAKGETSSPYKIISQTHAHTWTSPTIGEGSLLPPYKNLEFISKNNATTVPVNVIGIFDSTSVAVGWTNYAAMTGKYLRGSNSNGIGGTEAHSHTVSITPADATRDLSDTGKNGAGAGDHTHTLSATTTSVNNQPPYINVYFAYNTVDDAVLPNNLIAFFNAAVSSGWTDISTSGSYTNRFLMGASTGIGDTGGSSAVHTHNSGSITITSTSGGIDVTVMGNTGTYASAVASHSHDVTYTVGTAASLPAYRSIFLGKKNYASINVSGNIYTDEIGTAYNCTEPNNRTVRVKASGSGTSTAECTGADGAYSFTGVEVHHVDEVLTVFLDGEAEKATTITKIADTTSGVTAPIYQNRVYLKHENGSPITNANIDRCDSVCDSDIQFTSNGVGLTVNSSNKIVIASGKSYTPGGNIQAPAIGIGGTFSAEGNTINLIAGGTSSTCTDAAGTVMPLCINSGTFAANTSTINFVAPATTTVASTTYYNLGVGTSAEVGTGATFTLGGSVNVGGTFTIGNTGSTNIDTLNGSSQTLTFSQGGIPFNITDKGAFAASTSTVNFIAPVDTTVNSTSYYNLGVGTSAEAGVGATFTLGGYVNVGGTFTIGNDSSANEDKVYGSSYTLTLTGGGTPLNLTSRGGYSPGTSTVVYNAAANTDIAATNYYIISLAPASGTETYIINSGSVGVGNSFVTSGGGSLTIDAETNNPTLDINGNFNIGVGHIFSSSSTGGFTVGENWDNNGVFNANSGTVTFDDAAKTSNVYFGGVGSTQPFYNLFITTAGKQMKFDETETLGIGGSFYVQGTDCDNKVLLDSTTNEDKWDINVTGSADIDYADIEDSNALTAIIANNSTQVNGGNTGSWTINGGACSTNQNPNSPTNLVQMKSDNAIIDAGTWVNTISIKIGATVSDPDTSDTLYLCAEAVGIGISFTDIQTDCGSSVEYSGAPVPATVTLTVLDDTQYHWQARVKDEGGLYSSWVAFGAGVTRDFGTDTSPPTGGTVYDGTETEVDINFNGGSLSQLSANWSGVNGDVSGIVSYQYSIGSTAGTTDVKVWTSVGTGTSATATGLTLQTSQLYFFNVLTTDNAGNTAAIYSNGQQVAPSLTFGVFPATITFDNLNVGVGYSDSKTTTLTTSTNAYGGYVVRTFTTDFLRSAGVGLTVPDFDGGTYANPAVWGEGNIGFGYTSDDATIQGEDKFDGGKKYVPFSQTGPGDIIADHTDNVTGDPIPSEQFIITHKVKAPSTQQAANYLTTIIYTVTAQY